MLKKNFLKINYEPVYWEALKNNLTTRPYTQPLYHGGALEDDFGIRYYFNQIQSLDKSVINYNSTPNNNEEEPDRIYVPTDIYGAFQYVLKEKNIPSTRAVKILAGLTIQIEKPYEKLYCE
jgi:hypothetical protein